VAVLIPSALTPPTIFSGPAASGAVYHHGAHVVDWTPAGEEPVLWMSRQSRFDDLSPIRGGIPICWPWFASGRTAAMSPPHGYARVTEWRLLGQKGDAESIRVRYLLVGGGPGSQFPGRLTYEVAFGRTLTAALTVTNTSPGAFSYEAALHTYLAVGDVRQISLTGLEDAPYLDRAPGAKPGQRSHAGELKITGETDRVYTTESPVTVYDPVIDRVIVTERSGSANVVVWNPWVDKAKAMEDFGDDEWPSMICVETANIGDQAIKLGAGQSHTMSFTLSLVSA
jgi:glucose-6-phosphate 1-epimerase